MNLKKKIILSSCILTTSSVVFFGLSCSKVKKGTNGPGTKEFVAGKWDNKITIINYDINPGFKAENGQKQLEIETNFLALLSKRFNELKKQNELTKDLPDVKFNIRVDKDKGNYFNRLRSNNKDNDIYIANYTTYYANYLNANGEYQNNDHIRKIAQTATLKFKWQNDDNDYYTDGLATDKYRIQAEKNNEIWHKNTGYEYPEWYKAVEENKLHFDGSKYTDFYQENKLSYVYRGAIYIAGNKAKRDQIIKDWETKDFDKFISHGIVFEKNTSSGKYKYQVALLARHFKKSIKEINDLFASDNPFIVKGIKVKEQLGKATKGNNPIKPAIGFDDEGVYNFSESKKGEKNYQPDGFQEGKSYDDPNNEVIRVLTFTNPAGYNVALGRSGLSKTQSELISKALQSLTLEENTYGIYSGYNKFTAINDDLFKKFVLLQKQAETTQDLVNDIPEVTI
ncbi:ABC transporter thiamine pyrophosphate-binding lipoprotein p37/Cypl [Mycoplasmopsis opalescens]|uniref:ABC transporter thiamine pyrophosphate-binding lipoprotein p37/Cypl n=1 Tax=Mycoplasmopsis opalescens TaxID=114886 RepID=UPI0004A7458B|nr:hypothetical protein [Mycoplasmopsis opalescens]